MAIILPEKPIFVIGAERSGTTLLMAMLGCHPRIAVPEVGWLWPRFYPYLYSYGDLNNDENFRTLADEMLFGLNHDLWGMKLNPRTAVDEIVGMVRERSFAGIYCAMHERFAQEQGKPRWGQKTPHNLYFVGPIKEAFPQAQFIYIVRDGRDASVDYLESSFGPMNIFCAAESWKMCWNFVKPWREKLTPQGDWLDVKYEDLCRKPEEVLRKVCEFLGEEYSTAMLDFYKTDIGKNRGSTRDHKPLGHAVSDRYVGIYKRLLSIRDQQVFAAVAGKELEEAGYTNDVEPIEITPEDEALWRERDGRIRAALLDGTEGHILFESYRDWLVDQREARRRRGIWKEEDAGKVWPEGDPYEELIVGFRAWRQWKEHFSIKRQYTRKGKVVL
ncbi:MAG: sulfotransferase [Thermoanaerobacterales bacterium]|nr:sulfotransferase [Bacillota bacterium]MDI6906699.1 sulfotransferase [Thermoanaerobacterales bacterium]